MARNSKKEYLRELDRLTPTVRKAYLSWVADRVNSARVSTVETLVSIGNVEGILTELGIGEATLSEVTESVREGFKSGGRFEAPAAQVTFDIRNTRAENWIATQSSELVTRTVESQRDAIRRVLNTGMGRGTSPYTTALDIVGRRTAGAKRTGGIVGLNGPQSQWVSNARAELRSGDPAAMRNYLTRTRRIKTFDPTVRKAIAAGKPLTAKQVNTITGRYADSLLKLRGETIARTESIAALNAGRYESWEQAIDEGKIHKDFVTSTWSATGDAKTRQSHSAMNRQRQPHGEPFRSPTGALLRYPGDTGLGAGAADVVNCRCFLQRRGDFIAAIGGRPRA